MNTTTKENLKQQISRLVELENEELKIKKLHDNIKKEKEMINSEIMVFMESNNIQDKDIIFGNKKIKYSTSKTQDGITKKLILERLIQYLQSEERGKEATEFIYNNRNVNEKNFLKIIDIKK